MGFRYRKSINLGGGFKVNISKSGVGYSWGTKGVRFTRTATGKNRTTLSIPGTGISYVSESGGRKRSGSTRPSADTPLPTPVPKTPGAAWGDFALCLLLGMFGIHKFREGRIGMGILYLLTFGLFTFGWMYDTIRYLVTAIRSHRS